MNKTEAILFLEDKGFRFKNKKRKEISVCDPHSEDWYTVTTAEIIHLAESEQQCIKRESTVPQTSTKPQPTETVSLMDRDIQAISEGIEQACRIIIAVAVFCYVSGYTLGTWVHEANRWLVALHKRTCRERLEIVAGYIVDGIVSTKELVMAS